MPKQQQQQPLRFTPLPTLLGVTLDCALSFGQHIAKITAKVAGRCRVLTSVTSKQWGWKNDQLTKIYKALYLSILMYGAPAWQPWLAATRLELLERCQNHAFRVIAGQLQTLMRRQTAMACEKAARSDHSRRRLLHSPVRHRLVRPSWRSASQSLLKELPRTLASREPLPDQIDCLWASKGSWDVYPQPPSRLSQQTTVCS